MSEAIEILSRFGDNPNSRLVEAAETILKNAETAQQDRHRARLVMRAVRGTVWEKDATAPMLEP